MPGQYNSQAAATNGHLGYGWSLGMGKDIRLTQNADGSVDVDVASGFRARFTLQTDGAFRAPLGFHAVLRKDTAAGYFSLTLNSSQSQWRFPMAGGTGVRAV